MLQQFINDPIHNTLFAQIRSTIGISLDEIGTNDPHNLIHLTEYTQPLLVLSHYLHFITSGYNLVNLGIIIPYKPLII